MKEWFASMAVLMGINNELSIIQRQVPRSRGKKSWTGAELVWYCSAFREALVPCDFALAGAQGSISHMVSSLVAAPNLWSLTLHWIVCWINPSPAGNHLTGFSVKMQGKTKVGWGLPEHCVLTGSGEVSACLPAVLVEKTPLAGSSSPTSPSQYGLLHVPGIPSRKQGHRQESHTWFFCTSSWSSSLWKRLGFFSRFLAWTAPGKPPCSARRVVGGVLCSTILFAWKHYAFTEQSSSAHSILPVLKSPKALPGTSCRACHCNKCL